MKYDKNALKKMQKAQLIIYKDFEKMCQEAKIPFFVAYGAVLGAVRHGGFIPWDDDIDVGMLREDYNRLISYMETHPNQKYEMITPEKQKGCVLGFGKFAKKGTVQVEAAHSYRSYESGIAIDIFPFDATSTLYEERRKQARMVWIWNRIMVLAEYPTPTLPEGLHPVIQWGCLFACRMFHYIFKLIGLSREKAHGKYLYHATRYSDREDVVYVCYDDLPKDVILWREEIFPVREIPFEDTSIVVMHEYKRELERLYGENYMELPPENQRYNHPPKYVDFGDGTIYGEM